MAERYSFCKWVPPVRIMQMAEDLIRLSGKEPYKEINIVIIGLREGEKIYEELVTDDEGVVDTIHDKIMVINYSNNSNNYRNQEIIRLNLIDNIDRLTDAAIRCDEVTIKKILKEIIPEYAPYDAICVDHLVGDRR